jgi:hypothetical protein
MLLIVSEIDIYNSDMKHTLQTSSKWWKLESTIGSVLRDNHNYCDVNGLGVLVYMLDNILKEEFLNAPKNKIVHAYGRIGSKWAPFSLIASDNWEIDRVDFELNEVVLKGGETLYSVHFCPIDRRRVFDLHQRYAQAIGDVLQAAVSAGHGAPEPQQRRRGKSQPALERARGAIKELYPDGVPGQATEPNANLCRRVSAKLQEESLPGVSDDTILRAAGRRK